MSVREAGGARILLESGGAGRYAPGRTPAAKGRCETYRRPYALWVRPSSRARAAAPSRPRWLSAFVSTRLARRPRRRARRARSNSAVQYERSTSASELPWGRSPSRRRAAGEVVEVRGLERDEGGGRPHRERVREQRLAAVLGEGPVPGGDPYEGVVGGKDPGPREGRARAHGVFVPMPAREPVHHMPARREGVGRDRPARPGPDGRAGVAGQTRGAAEAHPREPVPTLGDRRQVVGCPGVVRERPPDLTCTSPLSGSKQTSPSGPWPAPPRAPPSPPLTRSATPRSGRASRRAAPGGCRRRGPRPRRTPAR